MPSRRARARARRGRRDRARASREFRSTRRVDKARARDETTRDAHLDDEAAALRLGGLARRERAGGGDLGRQGEHRDDEGGGWGVRERARGATEVEP